MKGVTRVRALGISLTFLILAPFHPSYLNGQEVSAPSAEHAVRELYDLVTFPAGTTPDWDRGRALFLPEGVVILRTGRAASM